MLTATTGTELALLGLAFTLSSLIGLERQFHQKSAGLRTYALVGTGSALFTLVSAFGFTTVLGPDVNLDPSRIAAQIVSGIGFIGAGVIFVRRDAVRGLTTAAAIWMTAAIGMACGAGMPVLAGAATVLHLLTVVAFSRLARHLPSIDSRQLLVVRYDDGRGVLRAVLQAATAMGFEASILDTEVERDQRVPQVRASMRFRGRLPLQQLVVTLSDVPGVTSVITSQESAD